MTAASPTAISSEPGAGKQIIFILILLALFYVGENYSFFYKLQAFGNERDTTEIIATSGGGASLRPLIFGLLGGLGAVCWMWRPAGLRTNIHGWLPALLLIFIVYTGSSVLWAEDQEIVIRRVVIFLLSCIGAYGISHRFSNRDILMLSFAAGGVFGALSLASEIVSGLFQPWDPEYRLYGITNANTLGSVMGLFVLAAIALRRMSERHSTWYLIAAVLGIGIVILTKSRTSLGGLVAGLFVWSILGAANRKRFVALCILGLALALPALLFLLGDQLGFAAKQAVLLGRESNSPETLTGRIPLWDFLISRYLYERPFFGFGFEGFWTPEHILRVSASQSWVIVHAHSGYINLLLDLGYVGLFLFSAILLLAMARAYACYRATRDFSWLFMVALLVWAMVGSLFDSLLMTSTLRNFICMLAFAKLALFDPRFTRVREPAYA